MSTEKVITVHFFRLSNGREPVRDFLRSLPAADKKILGEDIKTIELGWPIGMPVAKKIEGNLWESRSTISQNRRVRIMFTVVNSKMILLHALIKKTGATPKPDLSLARIRRSKLIGKSK